MLMVRMEKNDKPGLKEPLQALSNDVVDKATRLRNPNPTMPAWVNAYPDKAFSFKKHGSLNVFENFNPPHYRVNKKRSGKTQSVYGCEYWRAISSENAGDRDRRVRKRSKRLPTKTLARYYFKMNSLP